MLSPCPPAAQRQIVSIVEQGLGVDLAHMKCQLATRKGMASVMKNHGWSRNQASGVVGFHHDDTVTVLDDSWWTFLHEAIHAAGVNADRISTVVAEGLTEAIAQSLCGKKGGCSSAEHRDTYPQETGWVKETLLPAVGMSALDLGRAIIRSKNPPVTVAELIASRRPVRNMRKLVGQLRPQNKTIPSFNIVARPPRHVGAVGVLYLVVGAVLWASSRRVTP